MGKRNVRRLIGFCSVFLILFLLPVARPAQAQYFTHKDDVPDTSKATKEISHPEERRIPLASRSSRIQAKRDPSFLRMTGSGGLDYPLIPTELRWWSTQAAQAGAFTPFPCPFDTRGLAAAVDCGWVSAPLNSDHPDGDLVQIAFARVHSLSEQPGADPLLYIHGGPGAVTLENVPFLLRLLGNVLKTRDLIFFDQRGVGLSRPVLDCPQLTTGVVIALDPDSGGGGGISQAQAESILRECQAHLAGLGVDLTTFTSHFIAADTQALMRGLGYTTWNLYGISSGGRVALTVLRDFPQGVRSVILDSPAPPNADQIVQGTTSAVQAFVDLFAQCQQDLLCHLAYPDLPGAYHALVAQLNAHPRQVILKNGAVLNLNGQLFSTTVFVMLSNPQLRWMIPGLIDDLRDGSDSGIRGLYDGLDAAKDSGGQSYGIAYTMLCQEVAPFTDTNALTTAVGSARDQGFDIGRTAAIHYTVCQQWRLGAPAAREHSAAESDLPVLLLSGRYDLDTPPVYADLAAQTLSQHYLVRFPEAGHAVFSYGDCPGKVIDAFLQQPEQRPDTGCIQPESRSRFVISARAMRPLGWGLALLGGALALAAVMDILPALRQMAWRKQFALKVLFGKGWARLLWAMLALSLLVIILQKTVRVDIPLSQALPVLLSILIAMQSTRWIAAYSEPGLEILLACPRPFPWLTIERLALVLAGTVGIALLGGLALAVLVPGTQALLAIQSIGLAGLFLSGVSGYFSVRTRRPTFGVLIMLLVGLLFGFGGAYLLPPHIPQLPWSAPFDRLQALLWMVQPFLGQADLPSLTLTDFWINRLVVAGLGLGLFGLMLRRLRNTENLLLASHGG